MNPVIKTSFRRSIIALNTRMGGGGYCPPHWCESNLARPWIVGGRYGESEPRRPSVDCVGLLRLTSRVRSPHSWSVPLLTNPCTRPPGTLLGLVDQRHLWTRVAGSRCGIHSGRSGSTPRGGPQSTGPYMYPLTTSTMMEEGFRPFLSLAYIRTYYYYIYILYMILY